MVDRSIHSDADMQSLIAQRIDTAMAQEGYTLESVARALGVSKAAVSKWRKTGQISTFKLYQFAMLSGRRMEWFYGLSDVSQSATDDQAKIRELLEHHADDPEFLESALMRVLEARRKSSKT